MAKSEIAIRDIHTGEQLTDEYGIFNLEEEMELVCSSQGCRKMIRPADFDTHYQLWDETIKAAIPMLFAVESSLY